MAIDTGGGKDSNVSNLVGYPSRYTFYLNGISLQTLLEKAGYVGACVIYDIGYSAPEFSRTIETPGSRDGGFITRTYRQKASVTVTFALRIYDVVTRRTACSMIQAWAANGGTVKTNDRPGQILTGCICEEYPEITSVRDWTEPLTMTFSSYSFPYWQSENTTTLTIEGQSTNATLTVAGSAPNAFVSVVMNPSAGSGDVNKFNVTVGSTTIKLTGISVQQSHRLVIDYDDAWNIRIKELEQKDGAWVDVQSNPDKLGNRTADSSDMLIASCAQIFKFSATTGKDDNTGIDISGGSNKVSIWADKKVKCTFRVRGAWL